MAVFSAKDIMRFRSRIAAILLRPAGFAVLPSISLGAFWLGGEGALVAVTILLPLIYFTVGTSDQRNASFGARTTGLLPKDQFEPVVEKTFQLAVRRGQQSAVFAIEIEDCDTLIDRFGQSVADLVIQRTGERIAATLRDNDALSQTGDSRFSICLGIVSHLDLELAIQLAGRIQSAIEEPISVRGFTIYVTAAVGFCLHKPLVEKTSIDWLNGAVVAMREALDNGPRAIRAYSSEMQRKTTIQAELRKEVSQALDLGQIEAWFQPQISTDTGRITGFETLARWNHPTRGMVSPADFLPAIEQAGKLERLAEVMMYHAFSALKSWDQAGLDIPQIGVNFAGPELNNPLLVDKVAWELDRFDLSPGRLAVEVLETVVANSPDDIVTRNINGLEEIGCQIDLDDFGTGHASISSIRRFSVSRIKIDRSFVIKADRDPEQQRMIGAILTMAERLGVETLAEGVETTGEHALLSQLGCDHVQGFGIGKPMPLEQTYAWIHAHNSKLKPLPDIISKRA